MMICPAHTKSSKEDIFTAPVFLELWFDSILCQKDKVWNNCESLIQFRNLSVSVSTPMHPNHHQHNQVKKWKWNIQFRNLWGVLSLFPPNHQQQSSESERFNFKTFGAYSLCPWCSPASQSSLHATVLHCIATPVNKNQLTLTEKHTFVKLLFKRCHIVVEPGCCWQKYFSWHGSWRTTKTLFFGDALTTRTR